MALRRRKPSEAELARSAAEQPAADLAAQRGPVESEPADLIAEEEALDGRDFKTGAPLAPSLPPELWMSRTERERAVYEAQERIVERMHASN